MVRRARGAPAKYVPLPVPAGERIKYSLLRSTRVTTHGVRRRLKALPTQPDGYKPPPQMIRPRRSGFHAVEAITSGTERSLVGNDLLEQRLYQWRGSNNREARRIWLRIRDQIPPDSYFTKLVEAEARARAE